MTQALSSLFYYYMIGIMKRQFQIEINFLCLKNLKLRQNFAKKQLTCLLPCSLVIKLVSFIFYYYFSYA